MPIADTAALVSSLELKDKFTSTANKFEKRLAGMERSSDRFGKTLGRVGSHVGQGLGKAVQNIERLAVVAGGLAIGGAAAAVKWAGDFEAQLNTINTVARLTPDALGAVGESIRKIARDTGTPLEELTQGYYDLVSAGIAAKDANNVLLASNRLAIGGLGSTAETVDLLTTAINAYGGNAKNAAGFADIFAKAIERGKVTAADIAQSFAQVGPLAASYGIEINEIAAAYAQLSAQGFTAGDIATEFRSALLALAKETPALEKLEKATGKSYLAIAGKQGLVVALQQLVDDGKKAGVPVTDLVGRIEALTFITTTTGANLKDYQGNLKEMGNAAGTAAAQMAERQKGLNFQLQRLKQNVQDAGITIGSALLPPLADLAGELTGFLTSHQDDIKSFGKNLAEGFKEAVAWAKKLDFKSIGDSLKTAAGFAKGLIDAFLNAPDWLKTAVITGWGLNKLTGGALTGIGGDLLKGLGSRFLDRGSSPVNPLFVSMTGVPGVGGVAGAGALGKVASIAQKVFIVGMVAEVADLIQGAISPGGGLEGRTAGAGGGLLAGDKLAWPFGPKNTPHVDLGPWKDILRGDSTFSGGLQSIGSFKSGFDTGGGSHSEDRKIELNNIDAIRANTVALRASAASIEKAFLKNIDPESIGARSKAITGHAATKDQIARIRTGDVLHQLKVITEKSKASTDVKLERLRVLAADSKARGDTKTAAKIQTAIDRMKASVSTAVAAGAAAVVGAVVGKGSSPVNVYVTTNLTANSVTRTTTKVARYGNTGGDRRYDP